MQKYAGGEKTLPAFCKNSGKERKRIEKKNTTIAAWIVGEYLPEWMQECGREYYTTVGHRGAGKVGRKFNRTVEICLFIYWRRNELFTDSVDKLLSQCS